MRGCRSGCAPAGRRSRGRPCRGSAGWPAVAAASSWPANAGRITSITAVSSARRTNRPRTVPGGCSRTPWASMRGSSSSRRSIASCRSAGFVGLGQGDVVLDRPALGVLGVQRLVDRDAEAAQDRPLALAGRRRCRRAGRAGSRSRGRSCGSGSRCARGPTGRGRSAPTPGTGAAGSASSGRRGPGRRGRACRAARRRGAAAARTPPDAPERVVAVLMR